MLLKNCILLTTLKLIIAVLPVEVCAQGLSCNYGDRYWFVQSVRTITGK